MKKRILGFVLAICLIVPCAFILSACNDNAIYAGKNMTLADAVEQAQDGDLIKLDSNITLDAQVSVNKKVTIDLCGYTINNTVDIWDKAAKEWSLISVAENGDLTIKNGTLRAKENDCYALDVRGGKLTILSGKYVGNVTSVYVYSGEAVINGGEFDIQQLDPNTNDSRYTLNCFDANYKNNTAIITVTGGRFANYNPNGSTSENPAADFLADGYTATAGTQDQNGDVWYQVEVE